jgi:maltose-binding protein MalE
MIEKKLSRREFLHISALTAAGVALAGCQPAATEPPPAEVEEPAAPTEAPAEPEGKVIQYWFSWGNFLPVWEEGLMATQEFKDAIGNDTLELKPIPNAPETLLTAVAAGTPPDGASNVQYLDYMARDVLLPIDDMVATSSIVKKEDYLEGTWSDAFYQGTMYGVPADEGFLRYGLNYNARMAEDAGLDPDDPPVTWDDCLVWHEALTKFDSAGNMVQIGLDPYDAMGGQIGIQDGFYPPVSWGWDWFNEDTGEFDVDNDMMIESLEVMGEFYKIAGPDNMAGMRQVEGQGGWGGSFNVEVQAMIIEGYWHPGETVIEKPEVAEFNRSTWAPVPENRRGVKVQGTGGHYVILFKEGKNTDGMFRIAEFLNTNAACDLIFKGVGWLPGLIPYLETVDTSAYPGLKFYFDSVEEATEWSSPARCPITSFASNQYQELREAVYREQMTAAEAAAEFQARCEAEWIAQGFG